MEEVVGTSVRERSWWPDLGVGVAVCWWPQGLGGGHGIERPEKGEPERGSRTPPRARESEFLY